MRFPGSRPRPAYGCTHQGISAGWADDYNAAIDCQWVDITDVTPGNYVLAIEVNPERSLYETSYRNNVARLEVVIPSSAGLT